MLNSFTSAIAVEVSDVFESSALFFCERPVKRWIVLDTVLVASNKELVQVLIISYWTRTERASPYACRYARVQVYSTE